jgi:predicted RND superfamily exporter protein
MNRKFGLLVTENPGLTLVLVLFVSLIMTGISLSPQRFGLEKDDIQEEKDWIPDNDEAKANEKVQDNYGVGATYLQVVVRGKDGNTLGKAALVDILSVEKRIAENQKVQDVLFPYQGNISSVSSALCWMMLSQAGVPQENMSYQLMLDTLNASNQSSLDTLITAAAPKLAMFLTKDFMTNLNESGVVKAKGTMILVLFNSDRYDDIDRDMEYNPIIDADEEILEILDTSEFKGVSRMGLVELEYVNQEMA